MNFLRKIILFVYCCFIWAAFSPAQNIPPRPQGYVSDFADVVSSAERRRIESLSQQLYQKTGIQLAVVTVSSIGPRTIEQYAVDLFQQWGIGQAGKDNGVLFLTAVQDRHTRIEVGYGLEGVLTDAVTRSIIERFIVPAFRQGQYSKGVEAGTLAIVSLIAQDQGIAITGQEDRVYQEVHEPKQEFNIFSFIILVILVIIFIKNPRLFFFFLMMSMMSSGRRGSGYGSGFGGGFGGFGGGMSGGGGASGRW
jgi:uncharacterized protein